MEESNLFSQENLIVHVHTPNSGSYQGIVVETVDTHEGYTRVVTDFPRAKSPSLPIGVDTSLVFSSSSFAAPLQTSGRVYLRSEDHFRHRYLFEFQKEHVATLGQAINQRRAPRVFPDPSAQVSVVLEQIDGGDRITTQLHDLSATGLGVIVSRHDENTFFSEWKVRLHFTLPSDNETFDVVGVVRNRKLVDGGVHYGIEFDPLESGNFDAVQERLIGFVMSRQAEAFRQARIVTKQAEQFVQQEVEHAASFSSDDDELLDESI